MHDIRMSSVVGGFVASVVLLCGMPGFAAAPADAGAKNPPTLEQITKVAENPRLLGALITDVTDDEAVDLLMQVVAQVDTLKLGIEGKKNRVAALFQALIDVKGAIKGNEIIARIVKKVNPRLLPIIRVGAGAPPPKAPPYKRQ